MCGIAGIYNLNGENVSKSILKEMTNSIKHRGPDGDGFFIENNIGLGHRRLSILDLSMAGNQPMESANQRYVLSYNGEVYNYLELRSELKQLGHQFFSKTDSEVVLNSWTEWGEKCVKRFNGMFAFSIWDKKEKTLFLVRDRYGIKPLYYAQFGKVFLFASEQKAILKNPKSKTVIDKNALVEYFTFQNLFTNNTLLKNIKLLSPASIGKISSKDHNLVVTQYWDYQFKDGLVSYDTREVQEELIRLIKQAISRQLVSDVEIGSYLSGGMDSGTITSIASKKLPFIKTFTCGFDLSTASGIELSFDERKEAENMSAIYKTEHYEIVLKSGDMERCLNSLTYHLEEPRVGQSYPNYYIAKLASKFVKVVLSGTGGDELFGGYPWRYFKAINNNNNFDEYINEYFKFWQRLLKQSEIKNVFSPIIGEINKIDTLNIFKNVFKNDNNDLERPQDLINHSLYFEAKTFLHGLFIVEDKLSMAHSMETRVPFMDNDLVDFAMRCPVSLKLNNLRDIIDINENEPFNKKEEYFKKTNDGKKILRDVMRNFIPEEIANAQKKGFSSPDSSWFKTESINFVKQTLYNKDSMIYDYMDIKTIKNMVDEHFTNKKNRRLLIWSLINIEEYLKINLKN